VLPRPRRRADGCCCVVPDPIAAQQTVADPNVADSNVIDLLSAVDACPRLGVGSALRAAAF
jgi:hypothetical protein